MRLALSCLLIVVFGTPASLERVSAQEACDDFRVVGPPGLLEPGNLREQMLTDNTLFMLRGLVEIGQVTQVRGMGEWIVIPCEGVALPLRNELRQLEFEAPEQVNAEVRRIFHKAFLSTIEARGQHKVLLSTRDEFAHLTAYRTWDRRVVRRSRVKAKTRVIYRSPRAFPFVLSVSETLDTDTGDLAARVLETEVAILRSDGTGDWDFYTYDEQGQLSSSGLFPAGERPSPQVCLACHYHPQKRTYSRLLER